MMQEASSAYIVAAVADAPPRSLPHDQHVHLCLYRARGVQRLPAPVCRFPVGVTVERMVKKFSIMLRTDMVIAVMVHLTLWFICILLHNEILLSKHWRRAFQLIKELFIHAIGRVYLERIVLFICINCYFSTQFNKMNYAKAQTL